MTSSGLAASPDSNTARPCVRDRVRHPLAAGPVLVEEDQGRPVRGEQVRARRPDPAGRAGDDPDPAAQPLVAGRGGPVTMASASFGHLLR